jgi:hypothetical protein
MENTSLPIAELSRQLIRGYDWGLSVRNMDEPLQNPAQISDLPPVLPEEAKTDFYSLFSKEKADIDLLEKADAVVDKWPELEDLREYLSDLCVLRIIVESGEREDDEFLESAEWDAIVDQTGERGTELLNLLVYLRDCLENQADPSLTDFLYEFLMVDDEDFQDELSIYEDFIRNQEMAEKGSLKQLIQTGNGLETTDMQEIFTPVMLFFKDRELKPGKVMLNLLNESQVPELHAALYLLLTGFYIADSGKASLN